MIRMTGKENSHLTIHQNEIDNYEISVSDKDGSESICNLKEAQLKRVLEVLDRYLDRV